MTFVSEQIWEGKQWWNQDLSVGGQFWDPLSEV